MTLNVLSQAAIAAAEQNHVVIAKVALLDTDVLFIHDFPGDAATLTRWKQFAFDCEYAMFVTCQGGIATFVKRSLLHWQFGIERGFHTTEFQAPGTNAVTHAIEFEPGVAAINVHCPMPSEVASEPAVESTKTEVLGLKASIDGSAGTSRDDAVDGSSTAARGGSGHNDELAEAASRETGGPSQRADDVGEHVNDVGEHVDDAEQHVENVDKHVDDEDGDIDGISDVQRQLLLEKAEDLSEAQTVHDWLGLWGSVICGSDLEGGLRSAVACKIAGSATLDAQVHAPQRSEALAASAASNAVLFTRGRLGINYITGGVEAGAHVDLCKHCPSALLLTPTHKCFPSALL
jgi:hypothetical protein